MAVLTVIKPGATMTNMGAGVAPAGGGDTCPNDGKTMLRFTNTNGATRDVTVTMQKTSPSGYITYGNKVFTVPATTGDIIIGPFPTDLFNDTTASLVLTYSAVTGMLVWPLSAGGA